MARDRRKAAQAGGLVALLEAGDHRAARATARARLAAGPDPEAAAVLASLAPERGAVAAGIAGAAVAAAVAAWTVLAG